MPILKLRAGKYMLPVDVTAIKGRLFLEFPFNRKLLSEVKLMQGRRWHGYDDPPKKVWSIKDCSRNRFQLAYLAGKNPYKKYDLPLVQAKPNRAVLYEHQKVMFRHIITRMQCVISGEMGVGKTLSAIEAMEWSNLRDFIWVGTGSSIAAVKLEFKKWHCSLEPLFLTYHAFRNVVNKNGLHIPEAIIFDEAQKLKGHNTLQSSCADIITEQMREKWPDPFIVEMSGAPAPNMPADWWHICEVACPGYIKEGDWWKFRERLAIMRQQTSASNQTFATVATWKDDCDKCNICGELKKEHDSLTGHTFEKSKNEVEFLYERMSGLNVVYFKKDCLDLPELQYRTIKLEPTPLMLKAEKLIIDTVPRTITALMKLRELSDGFQYTEVETGSKKVCPLCKGTQKSDQYFDPEYPDEYPSDEAMESGCCKTRPVTCTNCDGTGEVNAVARKAVWIGSKKVQLLEQLLEEHEDIGRFVVYAGFQASIDKCIETALAQHWDVVRADGRGWIYLKHGRADGYEQDLMKAKEDMLEAFQNKANNKIVFIGQAGAAGTGLTLTASPSIFFYSNSFNGDDRIQAVNRIHRMGMGDSATIIDCVNLETDQYVLDKLKKKIDLLNMSMGLFRKASKGYRVKDLALMEN